jgi:altronate dehydratase small subunit
MPHSNQPHIERLAVTRAIRLDARDNVAVATDALAAGEEVAFDGGSVTLADAIPVGHKFAIDAIERDAHVYKYGEVIGIAIRSIPAGAHVHVHNVLSARLPGDAAR